jgi:hypothetical protein
MRRATSSHLLLSALLPLSLAACASGAAGSAPDNEGNGGGGGTTVADGSEFTLQSGETATLADASRLRYVRLVEDSRCPPDVQCVWAGDAIIALQWTPATGAAQDFQLHTGVEPRSQAIGTRRVTLKSLARGAQPAASLVVNAGP